MLHNIFFNIMILLYTLTQNAYIQLYFTIFLKISKYIL